MLSIITIRKVLTRFDLFFERLLELEKYSTNLQVLFYHKATAIVFIAYTQDLVATYDTALSSVAARQLVASTVAASS